MGWTLEATTEQLQIEIIEQQLRSLPPTIIPRLRDLRDERIADAFRMKLCDLVRMHLPASSFRRAMAQHWGRNGDVIDLGAVRKTRETA